MVEISPHIIFLFKDIKLSKIPDIKLHGLTEFSMKNFVYFLIMLFLLSCSTHKVKVIADPLKFPLVMPSANRENPIRNNSQISDDINKLSGVIGRYPPKYKSEHERFRFIISGQTSYWMLRLNIKLAGIMKPSYIFFQNSIGRVII